MPASGNGWLRRKTGHVRSDQNGDYSRDGRTGQASETRSSANLIAAVQRIFSPRRAPPHSRGENLQSRDMPYSSVLPSRATAKPHTFATAIAVSKETIGSIG